VSEQRERVYRQASVAWRSASDEGRLPSDLRAELVRSLRRYAERFGDADTASILGDAALRDTTLVNFFAFWLDLTPLEKQCLLEEPGGERRARRLRDVLDFRLYAGGGEFDLASRRMH